MVSNNRSAQVQFGQSPHQGLPEGLQQQPAQELPCGRGGRHQPGGLVGGAQDGAGDLEAPALPAPQGALVTADQRLLERMVKKADERLHMLWRERSQRNPQPSAGSVDSQSVKTTKNCR